MRARPRFCRQCRRENTEVGRISWSGLCYGCGKANVNAHNDQLSSKSGPDYEHWRECVDASVMRRAARLQQRSP